jgi:hypothetical protein
MNATPDPLSQFLQTMSDFLTALFAFFGDFLRQILAAFLL